MNKIKLILVTLLPILMLFVSCTGFNARSAYLGTGSTTNPVQKYENPTTFFVKGGAIYYHDVVGGVKTDTKASKTGTGCSTSYLGLISLGDSSIATAKESVKITKIASLKYEISAVLSYVWHEHCIIITGE